MAEKPLFDIESKIKRIVKPEGLELKTEPYTWKESVVDEASLNRHKRMMRSNK
jgi:hypothetical protein